MIIYRNIIYMQSNHMRDHIHAIICGKIIYVQSYTVESYVTNHMYDHIIYVEANHIRDHIRVIICG